MYYNDYNRFTEEQLSPLPVPQPEEKPKKKKGALKLTALCLVLLNITAAGVFDNILADLKLAAKDVAAILAPEHNSKNR